MQNGTPSTSPTSGPKPPAEEGSRGLHPALKWALPPVIALVLLGAYWLGKQASQPSEPEPVAPPTVATKPVQPVQPPQGKVQVTEVPHAVTVTPVPPPVTPPKPATPPTPAPPRTKIEPPVVLPPEPPRTEPAPTSPPDMTPDDGSPNGPSNEEPRPQPEADRDPVQINNPAQEYPSSAYEEGAQGTVRVTFTVGRDGSVESPSVDRSSGDDRLDRAALDYVSRLKFRPAIRDGRPAAVPANRVIQFSLR